MAGIPHDRFFFSMCVESILKPLKKKIIHVNITVWMHFKKVLRAETGDFGSMPFAASHQMPEFASR